MILGVSFKLIGRYRAFYCMSIAVCTVYFMFRQTGRFFMIYILDKSIVAVPMFHGYAHNASCQHQFSPRNIAGCGLTDGENVERLWSYLGRFARMTKEMSAGNRVDLLTDALSHYCKRKQSKLG